MAEQKIFAGPRIRRIRTQKGLTQTGMAKGLGISPSYLNLIERNQRPLTLAVRMRLEAMFGAAPELADGVGKLLRGQVTSHLSLARKAGRQRVVLSTDPGMTAAQALYEALGYRRTPDRDWSIHGSLLITYSRDLPAGPHESGTRGGTAPRF